MIKRGIEASAVVMFQEKTGMLRSYTRRALAWYYG